MFSSRLHWELRPNRLSELLEAKRRTGARILDLTESNPTRAGLSYPDEEILEAFRDRRSLIYEPAPAGLVEARAAVAARHGVDPARVFLTASTSESYSFLFKLLADPGDEVLAPRPSYPLFEFLAAMESVRIAHYPLLYQTGWSLDCEALARAPNSRTRAVIVVNPNNPTGSFLKKHELEQLVALSAQRHLAIISDEVFAGYAFEPDPGRVSTLAGVDAVLTFCLGGLSKIAGLPQMKLGWIVMGGPAELRAEAAQRLELIADTYLSVGTPVQHALPRLLEAGAGIQQQIARRVRDNLNLLRSSASPLAVEGGWYAILPVPVTRTEEEWCLELLDRDHVLVQPGFFYDLELESCLVISLLPARETFREGLTRLLERVR